MKVGVGGEDFISLLSLISLNTSTQIPVFLSDLLVTQSTCPPACLASDVHSGHISAPRLQHPEIFAVIFPENVELEFLLNHLDMERLFLSGSSQTSRGVKHLISSHLIASFFHF
eukprot:41945-Hanusia_phi.AAC.1